MVTAALLGWAITPEGAIIAAATHAADAAMARLFITFKDIAERPSPGFKPQFMPMPKERNTLL
jgi:hypothetical protein